MHWLPLRRGDGEQASLAFLLVAIVTGAAAWLLVPVGDVDVVDAALALAVTVITPYGLFLVLPEPRWRDDLLQRQTPADMALVGALTVVVVSASDFLAPLAAAGFWLVPVLGVGVASLRQLGWLPGRRRDWGVSEWSSLVALAWLAVGAAWLAIHEAGMRPLDLSGQIVELTAVHFHYAGFASTVIAREVWIRTHGTHPRLAAIALGATAGAPPVVAVGFAAVPALQVVGAALLALGLWTVAGLTLRVIAPATDDRTPASFLAASALAVLVPMVLAVQWALGNVAGTPALSIPDMAAFHGTTNALGFALLGLLGWRRLTPDDAATLAEHARS